MHPLHVFWLYMDQKNIHSCLRLIYMTTMSKLIHFFFRCMTMIRLYSAKVVVIFGSTEYAQVWQILLIKCSPLKFMQSGFVTNAYKQNKFHWLKWNLDKAFHKSDVWFTNCIYVVYCLNKVQGMWRKQNIYWTFFQLCLKHCHFMELQWWSQTQ